ncbi:MAG: hypothetical protein R2795_00965 [Saprospiraceae bacterium]
MDYICFSKKLNDTMFQLFLQSATITAGDWDKVYPQIVEVAEEEDSEALFFLRFLLSLKIYDQ